VHHSLADYVSVITPYLSSELVSAAALSRIQAIAQTLKPTWGALLECDLSCRRHVNFSLDLLDTEIDLHQGMLNHPVWQRIQQLGLDCANPTSTGQEVASIGLKFNIDEEQPEIPLPDVFLSLQEEHLQILGQDTNALNHWLSEKVIKPLLGHPIPLKLQQNLFTCLEALPVGAQVLYMGIMLTRQLNTIRINVSGIPTVHLSEYLVQIGWSGQVAELEVIALRLHSLVDRIVLNFDIGVTVPVKIGLECFLDRRLAGSSQWQPLLNYLVKSKLCTQKKCNALLDWPGFCDEKSCPVPWPRNLTTVSNFLGTRASSVVVRDLNHIELTLQPGNSLEAKGYLWFGPDWIS
jgi:hypothetical protein